MALRIAVLALFPVFICEGPIVGQHLPPGERVGGRSGDAGGCALAAQDGAASGRVLFSTSGDAKLDTDLSQELGDLRYTFQANPFFALYDDSLGKNAYSMPGDQSHPDGYVVFGVAMMASELKRTNYTGYTIPIIMAHEFGHVVQFRNGISHPGKLQELQADYFAGWYMGKRERNKPEGQDVVIGAARTFFGLGEYDFSSKDHHGTPDERKAAIFEGYLDYRLSLQEAIAHSETYVQHIQTSVGDR